MEDIVLAVNMPPHAPGPGHAWTSMARSSSSSIRPACLCPTASKTVWIWMSRPRQLPGSMDPP